MKLSVFGVVLTGGTANRLSLLDYENQGMEEKKHVSKGFLGSGAAFISFLLSVSLWFAGRKDSGMFVGLWVPTIMAVGIFFKSASGGRQDIQ